MLASADDALGSVLEGASERRHVMRRVGQSMRLRRGNTSTTPGGHDAVDVPVSQGILRLNSSDDDCVSHVAEGGSSSLDKQVRCYLRPLRRRASKVEEPC